MTHIFTTSGKSKNEMVWDSERRKALCKFEEVIKDGKRTGIGEFMTDDKRIIRKLHDMGYSCRNVPEDELLQYCFPNHKPEVKEEVKEVKKPVARKKKTKTVEVIAPEEPDIIPEPEEIQPEEITEPKVDDTEADNVSD